MFHRDRFWDPFYILFIIFIVHLFFINNGIDFASYVDDTTPYVCRQNFSEVINLLESKATKVFKCFMKTV